MIGDWIGTICEQAFLTLCEQFGFRKVLAVLAVIVLTLAVVIYALWVFL